MKDKIVAFLKDESGQTATEYILLLAVVALIIFKFKEQVQKKLVDEGGLISKVFGKTDDILKDF